MTSLKSIFTVTVIAIASLQYVSSYACPAIPNCQTQDVCFAFDSDPSTMVWGPCESCPAGQGMCLQKSSGDTCLSATQSTCTGNFEYAIPNCSSATKSATGIQVNHICGAYACCGITWSGVPHPKKQ